VSFIELSFSGVLAQARMGKRCLTTALLAAALILANRCQGAPVFGKILELRQPDGSTLQVRVWGDEFYRVVESLAGYTLVRDPQTKKICYATLSSDRNELISTGLSASVPLPGSVPIESHLRINGNASKARAKAAVRQLAKRRSVVSSKSRTGVRSKPPTRQIRGICILIDFPDKPGTIPPPDIRDMCNKEGYKGYKNNGSVNDYFSDVSGGNLDYTNDVPDLYYRAPNEMSYYDDCDDSEGEKVDELIHGALTWLEEDQGFEFSDYDSNGDGIIDAINFLYAGQTHCAWSHGLWPHAGHFYFQADGVESNRYQITSIGSELSIQTFCHENGHMLCDWPDLYDYGLDGIKSGGIGKYCLMCNGANDKNPVEPCAYLKVVAGWAVPIDLQIPQANLAITEGTNTFYKFPHPKLSHEYFLISNRQRSGRNIHLPDSGLAIWHIDEQGSNHNEQMTPALHYLVTLVQADGKWDLENSRVDPENGWWIPTNGGTGDATDLFDGDLYDQCTPHTQPSTNWWVGNSSTMSISNISPSASTMWFDFDILASPPQAVAQALVVTAGEPMTIKLNILDDFLPDPPGKPTCIITSLPSHGTLEDPGAGPISQINTALDDWGNQVVFTPQDGYLGADSFGFMGIDSGVSPDGGNSNQATVSIQVSLPIYVDDNAEHDPGPRNPMISDPEEDGSLEHPFDTIQEAIDHASFTETIAILPGRYTGLGNRDIDFRGKPIRLRGWGDREDCVIDCEDLGRGFYFHTGESLDSVVEGLTIMQGKADRGGAVLCEDAGPTLTHCTFIDNSATKSGGGIYNLRSDSNLSHCFFHKNSAPWGGGMLNAQSNPTVESCVFTENSAIESGGGMENENSDPMVTDCEFNQNSANWGGGLRNYEGNPTVRDCVFTENSATGSGGGMGNENSDPTVADCEFNRNSANWGGGMVNYKSSPTVGGCVFTENIGTESGGGMENEENSDPTVTDCKFNHNSANWGGGMVNYQSSPTVENCAFTANSAAESGGGLLNSDSSDATLTRCIFTSNSAKWGAGMYNYGGSHLLINCNIIGNEANSAGNAIYNNGGSLSTLTSCIVWGNTLQIDSPGEARVVVTYSNIKGGLVGEGNINVDPLFADPANGDYHLQSQAGRWDSISNTWGVDAVTSPCIDTGDPGMSIGLEPSPNGARINMGVYGGTVEASKSHE